MKILISAAKLAQRVNAIAAKISSDQNSKELEIAVVMKGAMVFGSDLIRAINNTGGPKIRLSVITASSYTGSKSTGIVDASIPFDCKGKKILIVEDIIDTGRTMSKLKKLMIEKGAKEVMVCSLLDKPSRRVVHVKIDYLGFTVPDKYIVGYGLDLDGLYRELPFLAVVTGKK